MTTQTLSLLSMQWIKLADGAEGEALSPEVDVSPPVLLPLPLPLPLKSVAYQPLPFN